MNNIGCSFAANREHILATNTDYFSVNAQEHPAYPFGYDFGRYVNFSGKQFSFQVIKEYSQWLYDGVLPCMASLVQISPTEGDLTFRFLAKCYVFGEHIDDKPWMNDIMDVFIRVHLQDWNFGMDHQVIMYTYEFTKETSLMRRLLVDMYAYCMEPGDNVKAMLRELPGEFAHDILVALNVVGRATSKDWRERLNKPRLYHHEAQRRLLS